MGTSFPVASAPRHPCRGGAPLLPRSPPRAVPPSPCRGGALLLPRSPPRVVPPSPFALVGSLRHSYAVPPPSQREAIPLSSKSRSARWICRASLIQASLREGGGCRRQTEGACGRRRSAHQQNLHLYAAGPPAASQAACIGPTRPQASHLFHSLRFIRKLLSAVHTWQGLMRRSPSPFALVGSLRHSYAVPPPSQREAIPLSSKSRSARWIYRASLIQASLREGGGCRRQTEGACGRCRSAHQQNLHLYAAGYPLLRSDSVGPNPPAGESPFLFSALHPKAAFSCSHLAGAYRSPPPPLLCPAKVRYH